MANKPAKPLILTFVDSEEGDWTALYVDGKLFDEGHSFYAPHLLEKLQKHLNIKVKVKTKDAEWFLRGTPDTL